MAKEELLIQVGIELVKMLMNGAAALAKTLSVPDDKIDEAFQAAKAEFLKNDPNEIGWGS